VRYVTERERPVESNLNDSLNSCAFFKTWSSLRFAHRPNLAWNVKKREFITKTMWNDTLSRQDLVYLIVSMNDHVVSCGRFFTILKHIIQISEWCLNSWRWLTISMNPIETVMGDQRLADMHVFGPAWNLLCWSLHWIHCRPRTVVLSKRHIWDGMGRIR
jgi:hypothetical protein